MARIGVFTIFISSMLIISFKNLPWPDWQKHKTQLLFALPIKKFIFSQFVGNALLGFLLILSAQFVYFEWFWVFLGCAYAFKAFFSQIYFYFLWKPFGPETTPKQLKYINKIRYALPFLVAISWIRPLELVDFEFLVYPNFLVSIILIFLFVFTFLIDVFHSFSINSTQRKHHRVTGKTPAPVQFKLSSRIRSLLRTEWERQFPDVSKKYSHWQILGDDIEIDVVSGTDLKKALDVVEDNFGKYENISAKTVSVDKSGNIDSFVKFNPSISKFKTDCAWIRYFENQQ